MNAKLIQWSPILDTPQQIVQVVIDSLTSEESKRSYSRHLREFMLWYQSNSAEFNKAGIQRYAAELHQQGLSPQNINLKLSAIRKLAREAEDNGALDSQIASGIGRVKGIRQEGQRTGNWMTKKQAQTFLESPNAQTLKGKRDRALFAVLIGCGLRRTEAANLTMAHVQQRDSRWVIVDLVGKRNKVRSVPMPNWAKTAIDEWAAAAGITEGIVFRPVNKGGRILSDSMTDQAIWKTVTSYSNAMGLNVAPHDLRRTFAKLAHQGGSGLDQIQLSLGHNSIKTTEKYLGVEQDFTSAPCDHLGLKL